MRLIRKAFLPGVDPTTRGYPFKNMDIGDMVIVDRTRNPKTGDIVVAEVDHDWTMKYYIKRGAQVILRPANRNYSDIHPQIEL